MALPADADVAEAARLMLDRRIKSIPIVQVRQVVGILVRRDLLAILTRSDEEVATALEALLGDELGPPSPYRVTVRDGVVLAVRAQRPDHSPAGRAAGPWCARRPWGPLGRGVMPIRSQPHH